MSLPRDPVPGKSQSRFVSSLGDVEGKVCTYGDLNALIGQDESGVGAGELSGRHGDVVPGIEDGLGRWVIRSPRREELKPVSGE